jgi:hypothetical protein
VASKYVANRDKDCAFGRVALRRGTVSASTLRDRVKSLPLTEDRVRAILFVIKRDLSAPE